MVIVKLYGGVGNQLFQVFAAVCAARRLDRFPIVLDFSIQGSFSAQHIQFLSRIVDFESPLMRPIFGFNRLGRFRVSKWLSGSWFSRYYVNDHNATIIYTRDINNKFIHLDGYFQSAVDDAVVDEHLDAFINFLSPKFRADLKARLRSREELVVHVRGGDFLKGHHGSVCDINYYKNAMSAVEELGHLRHALIITDDLAYGREMQGLLDIERGSVGSEDDPYEDFVTLCAARGKIISNSTFSIWAAILGSVFDDGSGFVLAPSELVSGVHRSFRIPSELS